jgi:hypothetical protein
MFRQKLTNTSVIGIFLFFFFLFVNACKKESVNDLQCDTAGWNPDSIRYSNTVSVIISQNCLRCHANSIKKGWVTLEGYDHLKKYVDNHKLLGAIGHLKGYRGMPKHSNQLPQDEICKIKFWVDKGALNN